MARTLLPDWDSAIVLSANYQRKKKMTKMRIEEESHNRIHFSQRLFWTFFAMFLAFISCFLLFQYQREREFVVAKLNNVLSNYNYKLFRKCYKCEDISTAVNDFMQDIPQNDLRVTIIDPSGQVLFDNSGTDELDNHNNRSEVRKARLENEVYAIRSSSSTGKRYFYSASNIGVYFYR